ncbi:MAG: hypothetical protein FD123_3744 [Bacteroidetes bacterium]|nr:MAG: hypothetical protein FD123_3744 [Bacteroidota bacterium]
MLAAGISALAIHAQKITSSTIGALEARQIGPAVMSGRITAIDAENKNTRIIYVGTAGGGIWKSTNAGSSYKPVFDKHTQCVGALVIDQENPETVWAGTGESNMRNSVSIGTGLYKSNDGGSNWKMVGLDSTEHISKIVIDPQNSNTVYVAAPGPLWSDSKQRGLYKTTDGGETWTKILYTDVKTGCADIVIDPKNPNVLYASMWQFRRTPWSFSSGGKTSALYKSTDAGKTWTKMMKGFEGDEFGRICLAISPSDPNRLYAIAESKKTQLYMTTDGGANWTKKSGSMNVSWRPFYFSLIMVDPVDPQRIYRPSLNLSISTDGGESFKEASFEGGWVHSDHHALWINPNNNSHLLLGTDGGVYQSLDKGNSWQMFGNLPVSQFYHVQIDDQVPYNVYGGLQDNGSWYAPSQSVNGIENKDWENCGGGDGFWVQPDREDHNYVYSEYQGGNIMRYNKRTNESKDIKPYPLAGEPKLRCNWNTPIVTSPTNKKTLYYGAQYLYRTRDRGESWEKISPDLTTNNPKKQEQDKSGGLSIDNSGAENHCTIFTIAESPLDENMIWVGTDDGNIQLTTDGGKKWTKMNAIGIKGLPAFAWVSSIEPSPYDKNVVFATFDNHAMGDMKTYVYKSADMGKTWTPLMTEDLKGGFAHKIKQDIVKPELLFLGTEFGLWMSFDAGTSWILYKSGDFPPVSVRDITIDKNTGDLVMGTHGRGVVILDDLTPLRALTPELLGQEMTFVAGRPSPITNGHYGGAFPGGGYAGPNSSEAYVFYYYFKDRVSSGEVKIEIYNDKGELVNTLLGNKRKGLNKATWDLRWSKGPRVAKGVKVDISGFIGQLVSEGTYTVKLIKGDKSITQTINVAFPKNASRDEMKQREEWTQGLFTLQEELAFQVSRMSSVEDSAAARAKQNKALEKTAQALANKLKTVREKCVASIEGTNITGEEKIREKIGMLYYQVAAFDGKPTQMQVERVKGLKKEVEEIISEADKIYQADLAKFNAELKKYKLPEITPVPRDQWERMTKSK